MHIHNLFDNKRFFYDSIQYGNWQKYSITFQTVMYQKINIMYQVG